MEKQDILVQFGNKIRALRLERDWSQQELGFKTGLHRNYIGMVERAERNISLKNIKQFADTFEVEVAELFKT